MSGKRSSALKLDAFESDLERSFEQESWAEVKSPAECEKAMVAAKASKSERTNIRLSENDLAGIKKRAIEKGLGYQTLIASLVHQYVTGRLIEADTTGVRRLVLETMQSVLKRTPRKVKAKTSVSSKRKATG